MKEDIRSHHATRPCQTPPFHAQGGFREFGGDRPHLFLVKALGMRPKAACGWRKRRMAMAENRPLIDLKTGDGALLLCVRQFAQACQVIVRVHAQSPVGAAPYGIIPVAFSTTTIPIRFSPSSGNDPEKARLPSALPCIAKVSGAHDHKGNPMNAPHQKHAGKPEATP